MMNECDFFFLNLCNFCIAKSDERNKYECYLSSEKIMLLLVKRFHSQSSSIPKGINIYLPILRPVILKMTFVVCLLLCLSATACLSAPQSGGVSAKLDWWRDSSFNSPSSSYLYTSFREKVII